jgi:DNA polymerase-4
VTLEEATWDGAVVYSACLGLLEKTEVGARPARLLGVSGAQLEDGSLGRQGRFFEDTREAARREQVNRAMDSIRDRFGEKSILPAALTQDKEG